MTQQALDQNQQTDMAVGEILRRTRVHYGQSIRDVESSLRIRAEQIEAIEQGDVEKLPARVYAIGFVRSYAEYLGLDGDKIVDLFKSQSVNQATTPILDFSMTSGDNMAPPIWLVIASFVVILIALAFWWGGYNQSRETVNAVPEVPAELKAEAIETRQQASIAEPDQQDLSGISPPPKAEPVQKGIILSMRENSWVEIRDKSNKVLLSRVLKAGDQYFVPDNAALTMSLGNAGGVNVSVDGAPLNALGAAAQVMRRIPLDGASLKATYGLKPIENSENTTPPIETSAQ